MSTPTTPSPWPPRRPLPADTSTIFRAVARAAARNYTESYRPVGYPGLTYTNLYTPAVLKAVPVDVTTAPGLRVAYLPGTGDLYPPSCPISASPPPCSRSPT